MQQALYEVRLCNAGVLKAVEVENERQLTKWGVQDHPLWRWMLILAEEMGEAVDAYLEQHPEDVPNEEYYFLAHFSDLSGRAKQLLEGKLTDRVNAVTHEPNLGKEIIQIAAVAVALEENRRRNDRASRGAA